MYLPCIAQYSDLEDGIVTYEQKRKIAPGLTREVIGDQSLQAQIHAASKKCIRWYSRWTIPDLIILSRNVLGTPISWNLMCAVT